MRFRALTEVKIDDLTDQDLKWISKTGTDEFGYGPEWLVEQLAQRKLACFRIRENGLLFIEILSHPKGKELWIKALAGSGVGSTKKDRETLWFDLELMARATDCRWVGWHVQAKGMVRFCKSVGLRPRDTVYRREI